MKATMRRLKFGALTSQKREFTALATMITSGRWAILDHAALAVKFFTIKALSTLTHQKITWAAMEIDF